MNINFIEPMVEKAYTEDGYLIVITKAGQGGWLNDINSHIDKRIIEYVQKGTHSYKEWDEFLKPLGYNSLWEQDFSISKEALEECRHWWNIKAKRDDWTEEMTESLLSERIHRTEEMTESLLSKRIHDAELHYNDPVQGIEIHYIPKGAIFKFVTVESRDGYGEYDDMHESVDIYWPEEFIISK